ncbi:putative retrotransposon protein [Tanacetum coccineum]
MARKPYSHQVERAKDLLGLIHTDVCGPLESCQDKELATSSPSLTTLVVMGEYMSQEFLDHLKEHGIIAHRTPPYTPQHNGVFEKRNRTLLDMALVKRDTLTKPDKLEPRSIKCIFVGYPKETIGYSFYYPPKNKVFVARNAEFLENSLITQEASRGLEDLEIIQEEDTHPSENTISNHNDGDQEIDEPLSDIIPIPKGFTQTLGINYEETFSPVADIRAIGILIAIATFYVYEIWQMDVKTAFLNRYLTKEDVKSYLGRCFAMKVLGEAAYNLGIKIYRERSKRLIGASTPAEVKRMQNVPYASAVGSILYAVRCTLPGVAFAPVKNILKYLRNTKDTFLVYGGITLKRVIRFGKRGMLNPRYIEPFKVLIQVGDIAYRLELPQQLSRVHSTFQVSNLKNCLSDEPLAISLDEIHIDDKLHFVKEPVEIMDREVKRLKQSRIPIIKVRWNSRRGPEFTWEHEDQFRKKYPHLFT